MCGVVVVIFLSKRKETTAGQNEDALCLGNIFQAVGGVEHILLWSHEDDRKATS